MAGVHHRLCLSLGCEVTAHCTAQRSPLQGLRHGCSREPCRVRPLLALEAKLGTEDLDWPYLMTRMDGWIEVPSFCLSTHSTIISLKLVADAACPGIIIHSLLSTGRAGRCWPHPHARHPGRGTRGQAGPWAVSTSGLGGETQRVSLGWAGCPGDWQSRHSMKM